MDDVRYTMNNIRDIIKNDHINEVDKSRGYRKKYDTQNFGRETWTESTGEAEHLWGHVIT
jgi:hypothetical protein